MRAQLALLIGLVRHWSDIQRCDLVVAHGGLLWMALLAARLGFGKRPYVVFDVMTIMSELHRHSPQAGIGQCSNACKARRSIWRLLEEWSSRLADLTIVCGPDDLPRFKQAPAMVVPHGVAADPYVEDQSEDPALIGFLGGGRIAPNRAAVEFLSTAVLPAPDFGSVSCRVVGDRIGYSTVHPRLVYYGFTEVAHEGLAPVSVVCAPMVETGGVSTKVLVSLLCGKRTVCTPEAARGIERPPIGLWVSELADFANSVATALNTPWSAAESGVVRDSVLRAHGPDAIAQAWLVLLTAKQPSLSKKWRRSY